MSLVSIENVDMRYGGPGGTLAVSGLNVRIERGEFVAVIGPSGFGKSTLMKLTTGVHIPQTGAVIVAGSEVTKPVSIVGMAFQNQTMLPWRTTLENILLPLEIVERHRHRLRRHKAEYFAQAEALLETVGLKALATSFLAAVGRHAAARQSLSRADPRARTAGARRAVRSAHAFTRAELWGVIRDLHASQDVTIVLVTYDLRESVFLADKVVVMSARPGRVVSQHFVPFERPCQLDILYEPRFNEMVQQLHGEIATARAAA